MRSALLALLACSAGWAAENDDSYFVDVPLLPETTYAGHLLTTGIGSAAFHRHGEPVPLVWTCTDRGPNADFNGGKQYPLPSFAPAIYKVWMQRHGAQILESLPLVDDSGHTLNGLPNPLTAPALTETAYGPTGDVLPPDASGVDTEGLVRLGDGSFWLADENAPSLLHVDATGKVLSRVVPQTIESDLAAADYPVQGTLPQILRLRRINRGFEAIAVKPGDDNTLYTALQSPLDHPANSTSPKPNPRNSRTVRFLQVDASTGAATAEWAYVCDPFTAFGDPVEQNPSPKQGDIKISELVAIADNRLIVLERTDFKAKLFLVDLNQPATNLLGSRWDDEATRPTLEQVSLASPGTDLDPIVPLSKTLIFDQDSDAPELPGKIEGVAVLNPATLMLINDNDFAIGGERTRVTFIHLPLRARN